MSWTNGNYVWLLWQITIWTVCVTLSLVGGNKIDYPFALRRNNQQQADQKKTQDAQPTQKSTEKLPRKSRTKARKRSASVEELPVLSTEALTSKRKSPRTPLAKTPTQETPTTPSSTPKTPETPSPNDGAGKKNRSKEPLMRRRRTKITKRKTNEDPTQEKAPTVEEKPNEPDKSPKVLPKQQQQSPGTDVVDNKLTEDEQAKGALQKLLGSLRVKKTKTRRKASTNAATVTTQSSETPTTAPKTSVNKKGSAEQLLGEKPAPEPPLPADTTAAAKKDTTVEKKRDKSDDKDQPVKKDSGGKNDQAKDSDENKKAAKKDTSDEKKKDAPVGEKKSDEVIIKKKRQRSEKTLDEAAATVFESITTPKKPIKDSFMRKKKSHSAEFSDDATKTGDNTGTGTNDESTDNHPPPPKDEAHKVVDVKVKAADAKSKPDEEPHHEKPKPDAKVDKPKTEERHEKSDNRAKVDKLHPDQQQHHHHEKPKTPEDNPKSGERRKADEKPKTSEDQPTTDETKHHKSLYVAKSLKEKTYDAEFGKEK